MGRRQKGTMPIGYFSFYQETKSFPRKPTQFISAWISFGLTGLYGWSKGTISPGLSYISHNHHPLEVSSRSGDLQYKLNKVEFSYKKQEESEQCQVHTISSVGDVFLLSFPSSTVLPTFLNLVNS